MSSNRVLSAREINHLLKYQRYPLKIEEFGQMPVEYITGFAEFLGREFKVTQDTLIPRLETEELVTLASTQIKKLFHHSSAQFTIAEIGTGSGCIGISLALSLAESPTNFRLVMSDLSEKALEIAQDNLERLLPAEISEKITLIQSDLLEGFSDSIQPQVVIANLPYIPSQLLPDLPLSVKDFEPVSALDGQDSKGLAVIKRLLTQSLGYFQIPELMLFEVDETVVVSDFAEFTHYNWQLHKDQFGKNRFAIANKILAKN